MKYKFTTPNEYNESTLKTAEEGVFITFTYNTCSNIRVQSCTEPINVLIDSPRSYNQTTTASKPIAMMFKVSPANLQFLKECIGQARIMRYDIVNEIYYVDNGYCEER